MATLYFSASAYDWSDTGSWFTQPIFIPTYAVNRIPNSTDTAIICGTISDISGAYVNPAVLQLGITSSYNGIWFSDLFNQTLNYNIPIVNITASTQISYFWAEIGNYSFGTLNLYGHSFFEGEVNVTNVANFYNFSSNGGPDGNGNIYLNSGKNAVFNDNSSNCSNDSGGAIYGNAIFNNNSVNALNGNIGSVYGDGTFNDNSSNADLENYALGRIRDTLTYNSYASYEATLQSLANAPSIIMPTGGGGGSTANYLLTELLKIPFPINL